MKRANRGLSLVEVLIASVILALLFGAIFVLIFQGGTTYADANRHVIMQRNAREVLERLAQELRYANPATLIAPDVATGNDTIVYQKAVGYDEGAKLTTWGELVTVNLEQLSAVDANHNGLSDDWRLVRTQNIDVDNDGTVESIKSILCDYVKVDGTATTGFAVKKSLENGQFKLEIDITLYTIDEDKKEMKTKVSTTVMLRRKV